MNTWVLARNTFGDSLRKRVLLIFLLLAFVMLTLALLLNYFTAREQSTIFKSTQLTIILIFGALISITTAVYLIPTEIDRRTIYSVLAKPVQRWEFFLGKFLGGALTVGFMVGLMSLALLLVLFVLAAKPQTSSVTQAQEAFVFSKWLALCQGEFLLVLRAIIVIYFQLFIVTAIATTLSLFLSPTVNFAVTAVIWIAGNFLPAFGVRDNVVLRPLYWVLPHFQDFNIMGSIVHPFANFQVNHWAYAGTVSLYAIAYGMVIVLAGAAIFDKREV